MTPEKSIDEQSKLRKCSYGNVKLQVSSACFVFFFIHYEFLPCRRVPFCAMHCEKAQKNLYRVFSQQKNEHELPALRRPAGHRPGRLLRQMAAFKYKYRYKKEVSVPDVQIPLQVETVGLEPMTSTLPV